MMLLYIYFFTYQNYIDRVSYNSYEITLLINNIAEVVVNIVYFVYRSSM